MIIGQQKGWVHAQFEIMNDYRGNFYHGLAAFGGETCSKLGA